MDQKNKPHCEEKQSSTSTCSITFKIELQSAWYFLLCAVLTGLLLRFCSQAFAKDPFVKGSTTPLGKVSQKSTLCNFSKAMIFFHVNKLKMHDCKNAILWGKTLF